MQSFLKLFKNLEFEKKDECDDAICTLTVPSFHLKNFDLLDYIIKKSERKESGSDLHSEVFINNLVQKFKNIWNMECQKDTVQIHAK